MNPLRHALALWWFWGAALVLTCIARTASGASLTVGSVDAKPGQAGVQLGVSLASNAGEEISCLQCDLQFAEAALHLSDIKAGAAAAAANKEVVFNSLGEGVVKVLICGLNRNVIGDGNLFAITFDVETSTPEKDVAVSLNNLSAASPGAAQVSLGAETGSIDLTGDAGAGPHEEAQSGGSSSGGCFISVATSESRKRGPDSFYQVLVPRSQ